MNARQVALDIFQSVLKDRTYINLALKNGLKTNISIENRRFITALVNTALENLFRIDYIIKPYIKGKRLHSVIKNILRLGVCQLLFFESVPISAAVNESVKLAEINKKRQLKGFVNAVLRNIANNIGSVQYPDPNVDFAGYLHIFYSMPLWLCKKYIAEYGEERAESLLSYKADNALTQIRRNYFVSGDLTVKVEPGRYLDDVFNIRNVVNLTESEDWKNGIITVQGEASMLSVRAAGIKETDKVLDVCAAPGGKSAYAAWYAKSGEVISLDFYEHRVEIIKAMIERLKIPNITAKVNDATKLNVGYINKFDVVLADVPCSALGLIYRKPDIKLFKTEEETKKLAEIQRKILDNSAKYLAPGGTLLYSTCTINKNENDVNIEWFLKNNDDFRLDGFAEQMPEKLKERAETGMLQLYPDIDKTDGFFIAKLKKENESIIR